MRTTVPIAVYATVPQWAPSRVTRRGALTATAAAAVAAPLPLGPLGVPSRRLQSLLPCRSPPGPAGPLGTTTSPPSGPMVAWQSAFSSTKYTFAVPFTPKRRNGRSLAPLLRRCPSLFPSFFSISHFCPLPSATHHSVSLSLSVSVPSGHGFSCSFVHRRPARALLARSLAR